MSKLLYGVGCYDGSGTIVNGTQYRPYSMWKEMLRRCYSTCESDRAKNNTYSGCSVCDEWLTFSTFEAWITSFPNYCEKQLDKDLLIEGNKIYSPDTCLLISKKLNTFITDYRKNNKQYIGSHPYATSSRARAYVSNPLNNTKEYLGSFVSEHEAHLAWKKRKLELGLELAALEQDPRARDAIKRRYS